MPVMPFKDIRDVIKFINERDKPLAVYYFGKSSGINAQRLASETSSGAFVTNELINYIASNHVGFGGVGSSGQGRHGGFYGFQNFSNAKTIFLKNATPKSVTKLMTPPYGPRFKKFILGWLVTLSVYTTADLRFYLYIVLGILLLIVLKLFAF